MKARYYYHNLKPKGDRKSMNYYLVAVWCDTEPEVVGPFASEEERDDKAIEIRYGSVDGEETGFYKLDIEGIIKQGGVTIEPYSGGFMDERKPVVV